MKNNISEINKIEYLTQEYFDKGKTKLALKTYRTLLDLYPKHISFYVNYIHFLEEEIVIAELLQNAYHEIIACCEQAIKIFQENELEYFYLKKLEIYIILIDGSFAKWYYEYEYKVEHYVHEVYQRYSNRIEALKRIMALYRLIGNTTKEKEVLDLAYNLDSDDYMIILRKVGFLQASEENIAATEVLENWILHNPTSSYLNIAYQKAHSLYTKIEDQDKIDFYQDLIDNK